MKMLLEFFHKDGNLANSGGIVVLVFFLKELIGPGFTNDKNLSRCELPQKGTCFSPVFCDQLFLPLLNVCPLLQ